MKQKNTKMKCGTKMAVLEENKPVCHATNTDKNPIRRIPIRNNKISF